MSYSAAMSKHYNNNNNNICNMAVCIEATTNERKKLDYTLFARLFIYSHTYNEYPSRAIDSIQQICSHVVRNLPTKNSLYFTTRRKIYFKKHKAPENRAKPACFYIYMT